MTSKVRPIEDAKLLLKYCKTGRLYDVEKWIRAGRSLRTPPEIKKTPLEVALETGLDAPLGN